MRGAVIAFQDGDRGTDGLLSAAERLCGEPADLFIFRVGTPSGTLWDTGAAGEALLPELVGGGYELLLFEASSEGNCLAGVLSAELGAQALLGASELAFEHGKLWARKPVYGGHLVAEFEFSRLPAVVSLAQQTADGEARRGRKIQLDIRGEASWVEESTHVLGGEEESIESAEIVFVAGRGIENRERFERLKSVAERFGAALGATRPVVFDALAPFDSMIGVSAATVAPKLCVVFGASGAAPFAVGIGHSKFIIGINSDPEALLFSMCDMGMICSCQDALDALEELITEEGE